MIEEPFENWLPIPNYEDLYEIDTFGNVRSLRRNIILKPNIDRKGYYKVGLTKDKKQKYYFIHRLVAFTFLPNPNNYPVINHKDGNPKNNYVENLEWCTQRHNIQHAYDTGLKKGVSAEHKGSNNPKSKLTEEQVLKILEFKKNKISIKEAFKILNYNISFSCFEQIWYGYNWKYLVEKVKE